MTTGSGGENRVWVLPSVFTLKTQAIPSTPAQCRHPQNPSRTLNPCRLTQVIRAKYGDDWERISRMSIIEEGAGEKTVRAHARAHM